MKTVADALAHVAAKERYAASSRYTRWSPSLVARVSDLRGKGLSHSEIGKLMGMTPAAIREGLKRLRVRGGGE